MAESPPGEADRPLTAGEPVTGRPDHMADLGPAEESASSPAELQYQSLYRRFRPQRFADVRGQDHLTRALLNTVRDGRISHAYLFSGPRGTGKTSTARILAMALNCAHPVDGEPDGTCPSCVDIRKGVSTDVQELDAASNRRIDEMRDLLSRVALGTRGRWKVYIIDEVHQLTADAASALLKTLEEPPAHVVFVLATTDPQKVLPTIRSRTIPFDFRLLPGEVLGDLLRDINEKASLGVPTEAIDLVVRRGHGSARDALTVLDQVAAGGGGEDPAQVVSQIVDGLAERDAGLVLAAVAEGMAAGRDARRLAADLIEHLRSGFLATVAPALVLLPDDAVTEVAEQARRMGLAALVRAMEVIGQALADMRDSVDPRVTLEVALVRLSRPDVDLSPAALLERIERLERAARAAGVTPETGTGTGTGTGGGGGAAAPPRPGGAPARPSIPPPPPMPGLRGGAEDAAAGDSSPSLSPRAGADGSGEREPLTPGVTGDRGSGGRAPGPPAVSGGAGSVGPPPLRPGVSGDAGSVGPPAAPPGTAVGASSGGLSSRASAPVPPPFPGVTAERSGAGKAKPDRPPTMLAGPTAGSSPDLALPSRDELTKAWGDGILRGLSGKARVYLASGRFIGVEPDGAVFALPNKQWLARSLDVRVEAETALAARFGRPVPLKLVVESAITAPSDAPAAPEEHLEDGDIDHLQEADVTVISPEQRLMDAFPGAEEVST